MLVIYEGKRQNLLARLFSKVNESTHLQLYFTKRSPKFQELLYPLTQERAHLRIYFHNPGSFSFL